MTASPSDVYAVPRKPDFIVTPDSVTQPAYGPGETGAVLYEGSSPLMWALENVGGQGTQTLIQPGSYKGGKIDHSRGGRFVAERRRQVHVMAGEGDTLAALDGTKIEPLVLAGLRIDVSTRAGFITGNKANTFPYRVSFEDCLFDGGYDHAEGKGRESKWGVMLHGHDGYFSRCVFQNIKREHGIYTHTPQADTLVIDCHFLRCGRTGLQLVGRDTEEGYSNTTLRVTDSRFEDCGLRDGGSHLTAQGIRTVLVKGMRSFIGRDEAFRTRYMATHPEKPVFGTGHIVNWTEQSRNAPTEDFALEDALCWSHPAAGHATAIQIVNSKRIAFLGGLHVSSGWNPVAIRASVAPDLLHLDTAAISGKLVLDP